MVIAGACGDTADEERAAGPTTTSAPATTAAATASKTLTVTGVDYAFAGVPAKIAPGTTIELTNAPKKEVHELVALRVNDGETRPAGVLLQLPEAERDKAAEFRASPSPSQPRRAPRPRGRWS